MGYLTVKEAGKKWGITARMVTYYCEAGRVTEAEKKGNLWLIPADVEKPLDGRFKNKQKCLDIKVDSNDILTYIDDIPAGGCSISQAARRLSLSKDTLRYYDKIGLLTPTRGENNYRFYTDFDLLLLQYIEVMKFVGLSLSQIGLIMRDTFEKTEEDKENTLEILKDKSVELKRKILLYQDVEQLIAQTIQSLSVMSCPADMERLDDMIKTLYANMVENGSFEQEIEG